MALVLSSCVEAIACTRRSYAAVASDLTTSELPQDHSFTHVDAQTLIAAADCVECA